MMEPVFEPGLLGDKPECYLCANLYLTLYCDIASRKGLFLSNLIFISKHKENRCNRVTGVQIWVKLVQLLLPLFAFKKYVLCK